MRTVFSNKLLELIKATYRPFLPLTLLCLLATNTYAITAFVNPIPHQHHRSIWPVLRSGFKLNHERHRTEVEHFIRYYQSHPKLLNAVFETAKPYLFNIIETLKARHLPAELALLPFVESGYRTNIQSLSGALGMWQLMPDTADDFNVSVNSYWFDGREDLNESTFGALDLLSYLHHHFDNHWLLAIAAYNSGIGTVQKALKQNATHTLRQAQGSLFWKLSLPRQTRNYVPKLLAISAIVANPKRYGMHLPSILDHGNIQKVMLTGQITLTEAAKLAGVTFDTINQLNPAYLFNITPNLGPSYLYIPSDHVAHFISAIKHQHHHEHWRLYRIRHGENLTAIAKRYHTSVENLVDRNQLASTALQPHQAILIPTTQTHQRTVYRIKANDSLAKIADKFGTSTVNIARINGIDPKVPLVKGERLIVN